MHVLVSRYQHTKKQYRYNLSEYLNLIKACNEQLHELVYHPVIMSVCVTVPV